jgi:U3 small nucleolar RNA-associated protein 22
MEQKRMKVALPSKDEQLSLHNTDILLKTNLTRLQLNEIVLSVQDEEGNSRRKKLEVWLEQVTDVLKRCDRGADASLVLSSNWLEDRGLKGFVLRSAACNFAFKPPVSVQLIGSYALGTATAPILNCDIAVVMSSSCFDARDILNHAYFDKKLLFLAAVADILRAEGICSTIQVSMLHGDSRKPYLMIEPNFKCRYAVRIFPCVPATAFKLTQLKPTKNNVRSSSWMSTLQKRRLSSSDKLADLDPSSLPATPFYNMAILEDIAMVPQFRILTRARETCPCFRDVCILLKVRR